MRSTLSPPRGWRVWKGKRRPILSSTATHRLITGIAARPDASIMEPRTATWPDMQMYMMTTSADSTTASAVFTENWGADRQLVFSGTATFSTEALGPAEGPQAFDYVVEFQRPFRYDPAQGNLLLEFFAPLGYSPPLVDDYTATSPGTWLGIALDPGATTADNMVPQVSILRFTFVPEPSSFALLTVLTVMSVFAWRWSNLGSGKRSGR